MSFKPEYVVVDFETSGLEFYRDDFKVVSMAMAWKKDGVVKSSYYDTPGSIRNALTYMAREKIPIVVFNAQFELGIFLCVYPDLPFNLYCDVMRLGQQIDGGGPHGEFGLKAVVKRHLPEQADYEKDIHAWILSNVPEAKKSSTGAFLSQAPYELLSAYNKKDVEVTLELYERFTDRFKAEKFDWTVDHTLYMSSVKMITQAKIKGVRVNTEKLTQYINEIDKEVTEIDRKFFEAMAEPIQNVREILKTKEQAKFKKKIVTELPEFNMTSKLHLEYLFCKALEQESKLKTPKGKPSFKASHLGQWSGAELLANRGKRLLVKKQAETLLEKASHTGRWHVDLKLCATTTGRASGGGGLNCQALSRRDYGLMSAMEADEGHVFVSVDLGSGEPSCSAHFSGDQNYRYATVDGVGKPPFYKNNVLMIDDIYLMFLSVSPFGSVDMKNLFDSGVFEDGRNFAEQWLHNADFIKNQIKKKRALSKTCALGLGYSMGPKKLQKGLFENGYDFDLKTCKEAFNTYWELFKGLKIYGDRKSREFQTKGFVTTEMGFRVIPDGDYKAFNNYIQATVAGIIHILGEYIQKEAPYAQVVLQIHDEYVIQCPIDKVEQFKIDMDRCTELMNQDLAWSLKIRTGFVVGSNLYEAK